MPLSEIVKQPTIGHILAAFVILGLAGYLAALLASYKRRHEIAWFFWGFHLPLLSHLALAFFPRVQRKSEKQVPLSGPWEITTRIMVLVGLTIILVGGLAYDIQKAWNPLVLSLVVTGWIVSEVCLGLNARWMAQKNALYSLNVMVMVILATTIFVGVNWYSTRHFRRFDSTQASRYSLSSQTTNLLKSLDKKVEVYSFFTEDAAVYQDFPFVKLARDTLEEYQASTNNISVQFVNVMADIESAKKLIKELDVKKVDPNSVIFACGTKPNLRTKVVTPYDMVHTDYSRTGPGDESSQRKKFKGEDAFTSAIQTVVDEKQTAVYFLSGHGERRTEGGEERDYSDLAKELKKANLKLEELQLYGKGKVPDDCAVLVIAGPTSPIPEKELRAIQDYIGRRQPSGKDQPAPSLLVLLEPVIPGRTRSPQLSPFLRQFNVDVQENTWLIEVTKMLAMQEGGGGFKVQDQLVMSLALEEYLDHEVTKELQGYPSRFATITCVRPAAATAHSDYDVTVLLQGSENGWGETNIRKLSAQRTAQFDADSDIPAPVAFGLAVKSRSEGGPRAIVIGDADFGSNALLDARGNLGLAVNSILWLSRKTTRLGLPPIDPAKETFQLTRKRERIVEFATLYGLPSAWILFAFGVWVFRTISSTATGRLSLALRFGILLGLVLLATGILFYSKGFETGWVVLPSILGLPLLAFGLAYNLQWVKELLKKRQTLYGANLFTVAVLAMLLAAIVNYVASRHYKRWDRTEKQFYALSDKTLEELKKVDRKVKVTLLLPPGMDWAVEHIDNILEEFHHNSPRIGLQRIIASKENQEQLELLEEQLNTSLTREDLPSAIFISEGNIRHVTVRDVVKQDEPMNPMMMQFQQPSFKLVGEQAFLDAVISVSTDKKITIYFSTGNGERNPESFEDRDFGEFAKLLKRANYVVKTLPLEQVDSIPSDCSILVLAAPAKTYPEKALKIVREHLENEGSLLVLAEPETVTGVASGLEPLLGEYSIRLDERTLIIDRNPWSGYSPLLFTEDYGYHPTTRELKGDATQFSLACQVEVVEDPSSGAGQFGGPPGGGPPKKWNTSPLVKSSDEGWVDRNTGYGAERVAFDEGTDSKGKGTIAVAVEPNNAPPSPYGPPPESKEKRKGPNIVVFGDADFASNILVRQMAGNEKLLLSSIRWLGKETVRDFNITPKEPDMRPLRVEATSNEAKIAYYLSVFGIPGFILLPGLLVFVLRKR